MKIIRYLDASDQIRFAALQDEGVDVQVEISRLPDDIDMDVLKDQVSSGALLAAARFDPRLLDLDPSVTGDDASAGDGSEAADEAPARIELYTAVDIRPAHSRIIKRRIAESVVEARADRHDIDLERMRSMLREPSFASRSITEAGEETADTEVLNEVLPFAFMFLMWLAAFMSGQYLITTTIEEKSNRVMEVLLSAVSPMQIMTGKILGQGLVAVVPLTMYGGVGIGALVAFATVDVIEPFHLVCFFAYFVIAYLLFASIMAALGSAVNDLHEAQSLMGPVMVVVGFAPWLLMFPAREDPNGLVATIGSFIPPVTPYVMMIRITAGEVPAWQIPATMALGFVAVGFCLWAASKVFRIGVLMTGKPPSFLELARWVRYR